MTQNVTQSRKIPPRSKKDWIYRFEDMSMLIYGLQGVGKTSFLNGDPDSVTVACEPGSEFMAARAVDCHKYDDFIDVIEEVAKDPGDFSGVNIDTVDRLYDRCTDHVCRQLKIADPNNAPYGKGWRDIRKTWEEWLEYGYRYTCIRYISHMEYKEEDVRNEHGLIEKVTKSIQRFNGSKASAFLDGVVRLVGYMTVDKDGSRRITFRPDAYTAAKDRTGILAPLGSILLPDNPEEGFQYIANLYKEHAEKKGLEVRRRFNGRKKTE